MFEQGFRVEPTGEIALLIPWAIPLAIMGHDQRVVRGVEKSDAAEARGQSFLETADDYLVNTLKVMPFAHGNRNLIKQVESRQLGLQPALSELPLGDVSNEDAEALVG